MKKLSVLLLLTIIAISNLYAQENPLNTLLEDIYDKDQFARKKLIEFEQKAINDSIAFYYKLMVESDEQNSKTVFGILDEKGWPEDLSQKANDAIFLVIQHASAEDRLKYAELVKSQAEKGNIEKKDFATLYDRVLMEKGEKQIYGTQMVEKMKDGKRVSYVWPVEDPENIDKLRFSIGLLPFDLYSQIVKKHTGMTVIWDENITIEQLQSLPSPVITED